MSIGLRTLVLNADMMPVNVLTLRANKVEDAIVRILNETCVTVEAYDRVFSTAGKKHHIPVPSVMMRKKYFKRPDRVPLVDDYILLRDGYKCVYCDRPLTRETMTWDHFVPQALGGVDAWDNILASCAKCNHDYGDTPARKKKPSHKPYKPSYQKLVHMRRHRPVTIDHFTWEPYIQPWYAEVILKGDI